MRDSRVFFLLSTAAVLSACSASAPAEDAGPDPGGGSSGSFDTRGDFHDVTISWHIKNLDDSPAACPAGFTTIFIHLYKRGYVEPPDSIFQVPCTTDGSITKPLPTSGYFVPEEERDQASPGRYSYSPAKDFYVDLSEATYSVQAATSFLWHVEDLASATTVNFDIYPSGGVGVVAWRLTSSASGAPLSSCDVAGVDTVEAALRKYDDESAPLQVVGTWPCNQYDPYFYYDPVGNSTLVNADAYQVGSGHTHAVAPYDAGYYVELRAKRAGKVVGTVPSSFYAPSKNGATTMSKFEIPINDR